MRERAGISVFAGRRVPRTKPTHVLQRTTLPAEAGQTYGYGISVLSDADFSTGCVTSLQVDFVDAATSMTALRSTIYKLSLCCPGPLIGARSFSNSVVASQFGRKDGLSVAHDRHRGLQVMTALQAQGCGARSGAEEAGMRSSCVGQRRKATQGLLRGPGFGAGRARHFAARNAAALY